MNKKKIFKNLSLIILLFIIAVAIVLTVNWYSSDASGNREITLENLMATEQTGEAFKTDINKSNYAHIIKRGINDLIGYKVKESTATTNRNIEQQAEYAFCIQHTNSNNGNSTWYITQILDIGGTANDSKPNINYLNKAKYYTITNKNGVDKTGDIYSKLAIYAYMQNVYKVENYRHYRNNNTEYGYENTLNWLLPQSGMTGVESIGTTEHVGISKDLIELENNYATFVNKLQSSNGNLFDEGQTKTVNSNSNSTYGPINVKLKDGLAVKYTDVYYTIYKHKIGTFGAGVKVNLTLHYTDGTSEKITDTSTAYIKNSSGNKINVNTFDWKSNFYIVSTTGKTLKEVEVNYSYDTYKARYIYLSGSYNGTNYSNQGYGLFGGGKYTTEGSYKIKVNSSIDVEFRKIDSTSNETLTKMGVKFNIYNGNTLIGTVSTTPGGNGITNKIALNAGTYTVKEVSNGNYGYRRANYSGKITITESQVSAKKPITIDIKNTKELKDLNLQKVGYGDVVHPEIKFIVSINDGKTTKYIRLLNRAGEKIDNVSEAIVSDTGYSTGESNCTINYVQNATDATIFITDQEGKINIKNLEVWANSNTKYTYTAIEQGNFNYGYKGKTNAGMSAKTADLGTTNLIKVVNIPEVGTLKIEKVDQRDNKVALAGVDFKLSNDEGYIKLVGIDGVVETNINGIANISKKGIAYTENGVTYYQVEYVENEEDATMFKTDENGLLVINNLEVYKNKNNDKYSYVIKEIATNNDYYEITESTVKATLIKDVTVEKEITNKQKYIDLSGYVWEDKKLNIKGGDGNRVGADGESYNDLYKDNSNDVNDVRVQGIPVRLIDTRTEKAVINVNGEECIAITDENGEYKFNKLLTDELSNYYVEFTYDGYTYTSVGLNLDKANGSKAKELDSSREALNNKYKGITNTFTNSEVSVIATTNKIEHNATELTNINLGIVKREQTDAEINNYTDIDNVKVTVNGYTHTYTYNTNAPADGESYSNISVTGQSKYNDSYTREIPETDIEYSKYLDENDGNRLKVYITYKIVLQNNTQTLAISVDELVNYIDRRYTIVDSWLEDGTKINWKETSNNATKYTGNDYKSIYTTDLGNRKINYVGSKDGTMLVYLQVLVDDETTLGLLNGEATLNNVSEVNSYTTYYTDKTYEAGEIGSKAGKVYASLDKDSTPGTAIPGDKSTYEDDTKAAPSMILKVENARGLSGTVWEDQNIKTNGERLGNGILDNNENKVENVKVELLEVDNSGNVKVATLYNKNESNDVIASEAITYTNSEGIYQFTGIIPGNYITRFTYGTIVNGEEKIITTINGKEISAKDYKSTIMASGEINTAISNGNLNWYQINDGNRYSDATDDLSIRNEIEISRYGNIKDNYMMLALTPKFDIAIEFTSTNATKVDAFGNAIETQFIQIEPNMDFGIIERPIVDIIVKKEISYVKVILQSGQVLIEGDPRNQNIEYVKTGLDGIVPMEIDTEILQGATLETTYEITVTNNSEIDYDYNSDNGYYYIFGNTNNNSKLVNTAVTKLVDYLDNTVDCVVDENNNTNWKKISITDLCKIDENGEYVEDSNNYISKDVYNEIKNGKYIILETDTFKDLTRDKKTSVVELKVSKLLSQTDDITINNYTEILELSGRINKVVNDSTPGNYIPGTEKQEQDEDTIKLTIAPPTGGEIITSSNSILTIISAVIGLAIIVVGIVTIKKFVISKK